MPSMITKRRKTLEGLTYMELEFVKYLLADEQFSPGRAAKKAGYKNPDVAGAKLLKRPHIARLIAKEQQERLARLDLTADKVLGFLALGLFTNRLRFFDPGENGWTLDDPESVPEEIAILIDSIKRKTKESVGEDGNVHREDTYEIDLPSKTKLLELAMKHCGLEGAQKHEFSGEVEVTHGLSQGLNGLLMQVEQSRKSQVVDANFIQKDVEGQGHGA